MTAQSALLPALTLLLSSTSEVRAGTPSSPVPVTPVTAAGRATEEDARILLEDARLLVAEKRLDDAIPKLERILERHPGSAGFTEAHWLLGTAYWRKGQPARAVAPLRSYIEALGRSEPALRARLLLARVNLELTQVSEALTLAQEVENAAAKATKNKKSARIDPALVQEARLLRARAWIARGRLDDAERSLDSVRSDLAARGDTSPLREEQMTLRLAIQLKRCDRYPPLTEKRPNWDEAQLADLYQRRGTCIAESLPLYRDLLALPAEPLNGHSREARAAFSAAYSAFHSSCRNPPAPPVEPGKKRTKAQLQAYLTERQQLLDRTCEIEFAKHLGLLAVLKESTPEKNRSELDELQNHAQSLRSSR